MGDADYRMAALLQRQLEQETDKNDGDFHLALELQKQFSEEDDLENPNGNLVYERRIALKSDRRSLVDPSWELVDPTPDIHNLFMVFNERFFWNKLMAVCVSWSKRMMSCAGICSYNGRGGLCSITLSDPLLKLRPRKDLVETLLHEMIHAYLFVTHNNIERDGHGPQFHEHMYRINKDAGTNITVYHSFHDEVRIYQQHWWKCNGPCQNWEPYYGMVRRSMNRAPGPNDRWWGEHSRSCGGSFIKVKEPEKKAKTKPVVPKKLTNDGDIRTFITTQSDIKNNSNYDKSVISNVNTVHGLGNMNTGPAIGAVFTTGNIHGFSNLSKISKNPIKENSCSTIVITKKSSTVTENERKNSVINSPSILKPVMNNIDFNDDYSAVRNHWLNKFDVAAKTKRYQEKSNDISGETKKIKCDETMTKRDLMTDVSSENFVTCPVCDQQIKKSFLNNHLDFCLEQQQKHEAVESCFICNKKFLKHEYEKHVSNCFECNFSDDSDLSLTECEICNGSVNSKQIAQHRKKCVQELFDSNSQNSSCSKENEFDNEDVADHRQLCVKNFFNADSQSQSLLSQVSLTQCSVCEEMVDSKIISVHSERCIHKWFDEVKKKQNLKLWNVFVTCEICGAEILKSDKNSHLKDCVNDCFTDVN